MWKLAALVAIALTGLIVLNAGGGLLPASAGPPPPVFVVSTTADEPDADLNDPACEIAPSGSGQCSLRAAIEEANSQGSGMITFDPTAFPPNNPASLALDATGNGELPEITVPLTIDGTGAGVILEPAPGSMLDWGLFVRDDTPATPTDFTLIGNSFTINHFVDTPASDDALGDGVIICGEDGLGGGCGSGPVVGIDFDSVVIHLNGGDGVFMLGNSDASVPEPETEQRLGISRVNFTDVTVSDNNGDGIVMVSDSTVSDVTVTTADIARNQTAMGVFASIVFGLSVENSLVRDNAGDGIVVDATDRAERITVSGGAVESNEGTGIVVGGDAVDVLIEDMNIQLNSGDGIAVVSTPTFPGGSNVKFSSRAISNRGGAGIDSGGSGAPTLNFDITNNVFIDNGGPAVSITDASGVTVRNNTMEGNGAGVVIQEVAGAAEGNTISRNSMRNNTGLGIDLGADGVTANDPGDADTGPNGLLNFPENLQIDTGTNTVTGQACPFCLVELFVTDNPPDPTGFGEGFTFLGDIVADGSGDFTFDVGTAPCGVKAGSVTATATDAAGSTSEFSANVPGFSGSAPCPAPTTPAPVATTTASRSSRSITAPVGLLG